MAEIKQSQRIQTSLLNAAEKKVLVWLADRQPRWMTSNGLTIIGIFGSLMIFAGYVLTNLRIEWLWLASAGFLVNWYGDSLDGTLARVRGTQRPLYGYYLDHTVDALNELLMFLFRAMWGEDAVLFTVLSFAVSLYVLNKVLATCIVMVWNYFTKRYILTREQ